MGLFEIMDDVAKKQIVKTETGDNRILGVIVGTVVDNFANEMPGRVCVEIPTRDEQANVLKWARVAMPSSGTGWGHYFLPEVGDQVLLVFEEGNIEKPYIIGCIPKDSNSFLKKSVSEKNEIKRIVTKHGSSIYFKDSADEGGEEGQKDVILIHTPDKAHRVELDNEKKTITMSDKEGENAIVINSEKGEISIKAAKKVKIQVGDEVEYTLIGSNGTTELKTKKFKVSDADSVEIGANKQFKVNAGTASLEGTSNVKLQGGPVSIAGSPIKIG